MEGLKDWLITKAGLSETDIIGSCVILATCILIFCIYTLKKRRNVIFGLLIRTATGIALILGVNQVLLMSNMEIAVGISPVSVLTCSFLGIPGVCLLYGTLLL